MKKQGLVKIMATVIFLAVAIYFWPQYQQQVPLTQDQLLQVSTAEVSQIPAQAPLTLVTQPDDGMQIVKDAIDASTKSLDLVIYELQDPSIYDALVSAKQRGVNVRVILQNINSFGRHPNQEAYDFLQKQGVPIIWAQKYFALTHQKTLIVDNTSAMIMTFNLVSKYYSSSRDFGIIDTDPQDVSAIKATFESDWNGSAIRAENGKDLVWSPGSAPTLLTLINSAETSLDIYSLEMDDQRITKALKDTASRGVNVRINMTYATQWKSALNELTTAGVHVRTYPSTAKFFIHAKVIIADNQRAFVGSENFSKPSLDSNRELGILITKTEIIESIQKTFEKDWAGSRPYVNSDTIKK